MRQSRDRDPGQLPPHRGLQPRASSQLLYAEAAALCLIDTYISIVLLVLFQLTPVIAPRIGRWGRA
jgi:hypothetical protein